MSVPLDKIKFQRPINFKEISVAKWRDPTRSALPYQGVTTPGPEPAFMPTYRRILKISGPEAGLETESEDEPPGGGRFSHPLLSQDETVGLIHCCI